MSESNSPVSVSLAGDVLADNPLLQALTPAERELLASYLVQRSFTAGEVVVTEGERERSMYFVLEGEGAFFKHGMRLGPVRAGEHFGELGLVAERSRAASVHAETALRLGWLNQASYRRLTEEHPHLAVQLLQAFIDGVADRLVDMTESTCALLVERSLPRRTQLTALICGAPQSVRTGTQLKHLLPRELQQQPVVAGLVDRKAQSLNASVYSSCEVEALTTASWEGQRIYRQSQALLLLEAAFRVAPGSSVRLQHSVGVGQRVTVSGVSDSELTALAQALEAQMHALAQLDLDLREEWWSVGEAHEHFAEQGWDDVASLLGLWRDTAVPLVSYGRLYALALGPMLPSTGRIAPPRMVRDDSGLLLVYAAQARARKSEPPAAGVVKRAERPASEREMQVAVAASRHVVHLTSTQDLWLDTLGIRSIGAFNLACIQGSVSQLIHVSEGFQEKRISQIADEIQSRGNGTKLVCIAGPSSSGKTTFIKRLSVQLQVNGINPVGISLDDYYIDRELTPRDAGGEYDFEALEALRTELLEQDLSALLAGQQVKTARYDFHTGTSHPQGGRELKLAGRDLLLLEGIHGLNPRLLGSIDPTQVFRIFVCPLAQLPFDRLTRVHASDVRLLRRIVRDRHGRGYSAADNILRWPSVRSGERAHIFPFQGHADAVFDTSLIYELSVLKVFAERYLLEVPQQHPAYTTAFRLLGLLDRLVTIYPDHVPPTSILREFIGGSGFEY